MPLTVNEQLFDRVVGHHVELQRLGNGLAVEAIRRLDASDPEIYEVIRRHSTADGQLGVGGVDKVLTAVRGINTRTYQQIEQQLTRQLQQLARYEVEFGRDLFDTVMPTGWQMARPRPKLLQAIITEEPFKGGLLPEWMAGMADGRYTRVRQAIRIGLAAHESADQLIRRVRGQRWLAFKDGALAISRRSAAQIIPSLVNHVANRARGTFYRENDDLLYGVSWSAVLDEVTCSECAALDGEEYDVEEAIAIEESGNGPPIHISCRCVLVPIVDNADNLELPGLAAHQRAALDGRAPPRLTYTQWLRRQDKGAQDRILGPERANLFRRGMNLDRFRDHTGYRYTLPELRSIEKKAMAPKTDLKRKPLTPTTKRRNYGWQPDLPDQRDLLFAVEHPEDVALPVRMSLREQMPPVFNQSTLGSCTANALVAATMFAYGAKCPMLSRLDLYYKERVIEDTVNEDSGAEIRDGIKALAKWGVCTEETWPYRIRAFRQRPSEQANREEPQYKIRKYMRLRSHDDFMKCLAMGFPFVGGFTVYENFDQGLTTDKGVLVMPTVDQRVVGGHAVLIVGYDQDFHNNQAFKRAGLDSNDVPSLMYLVRNSFGSDWGDDGYYWMPAPYLESRDLSDDFWSIRK